MPLKCSLCKETKDESCFYRSSSKTRGYQNYCISCRKKQKTKLKESMSEQEWYLIQRRYWLKTEYGMTLEQYNELLKQQDHKCAICKTDEVDVYKGLLYVDHCHNTKKIRGLLCHHCNTALGKFYDSEQRLLNAVEYLRKNNGSEITNI